MNSTSQVRACLLLYFRIIICLLTRHRAKCCLIVPDRMQHCELTSDRVHGAGGRAWQPLQKIFGVFFLPLLRLPVLLLVRDV